MGNTGNISILFDWIFNPLVSSNIPFSWILCVLTRYRYSCQTPTRNEINSCQNTNTVSLYGDIDTKGRNKRNHCRVALAFEKLMYFTNSFFWQSRQVWIICPISGMIFCSQIWIWVRSEMSFFKFCIKYPIYIMYMKMVKQVPIVFYD